MQTTKNRVYRLVDVRQDYWWFEPTQCGRCGVWARNLDSWHDLNGALCCGDCCKAECRCGAKTDDVEGDCWGHDFKGRAVCTKCQNPQPEPGLLKLLWLGVVAMWEQR